MHLDIPPNEKKRGRTIGTVELCEPVKKRTCAQAEPELSLPSFFYDATAEANERKKSQEKHAGKVRQFEHVKGMHHDWSIPVSWIEWVQSFFLSFAGNFPTFLYLKVPPCAELDTLSQSLVNAANDQQTDNNGMTFTNSKPYSLFPAAERHISLSRPFAMRIHQKELYLKELKQEIDECRLRRFTVAFPCAIDSKPNPDDARPASDSPPLNFSRDNYERNILSIMRSHTCYFMNEDASRSFLCLLIGPNKGKREILTLLAAIDRVQRKFDFPLYYENPQPHLSLAWRVNGKETVDAGVGLDESEILIGATGTLQEGNGSLATSTFLAEDSSVVSAENKFATTSQDSVLLESSLNLCEYSCSDEDDAPLVETSTREGCEAIEWLEYEVREIHCKLGEWSFTFDLLDYSM